MKINIYIKEPGKELRRIEIENTLESLQELVGGYIEAVTVASDMAIICNEEGRLLGLPYNCEILGEAFVGPILFVGVSGEDFADAQAKLGTMKWLFPGMFGKEG
ncbi:MAG: DUF3846 domain-containing protein [Oscillospiraceae bacterium]|nr:DUF3846 domain-containing protein [Oscillospiraceae bacterium]MBQ7120158.1 DUF3846 domain-containing protein [Oscillospiraceae bacterium]